MSAVYDHRLRDSRHHEAKAYDEVRAWLAWNELEGKAARTLDDLERTAAALLRAYPVSALPDLTSQDLTNFLTGVTEGRRRVVRSHLSNLFSWAEMHEHVEKNPMGKVPKPRPKGQKVYDGFSDAEVEQLCHDHLLTIMLYGGLRKSECRKLRFRDCHLDRGELVILGGKGGKDRSIRLFLEDGSPSRVARAIADLALTERLNPQDHLWFSTSLWARVRSTTGTGRLLTRPA